MMSVAQSASVADAIDKLVDRTVSDARAEEDAAASASQQQWDEAQGVYGDLGVAALDRSASAMASTVDSVWPYLSAVGVGAALGGLAAVVVDAMSHRRAP